MKQMIVLIAMVLLGIFIAGLILGFRDTAADLAGAAGQQLDTVFETFAGGGQ